MKRIAVIASSLMLMALPFTASAHQHATFTIGGENYTFVIGSLNEPIVVDDKSGLDLTITKGGGAMTMSMDGDMDGPAEAATPVSGLESTLKVELSAGDKKMTQDISPVYGKPGGYKTTFYPTVSTTFSYRLFGTIDNNPVDLTFTCLPEGATKAEDDHTAKKLSDSVTQTSIGGAFGCAVDKETLGFPEKSVSMSALSNKADMGMWGIGLGALGTILAGFALMRRKS